MSGSGVGGAAFAVLALAVLLAPPVLWAEGARAQEAGERLHEVRPGESLWQIAGATVGDPTLWPALYLANRDRIKDPARVYPGQHLAIPVVDPAERAAIRREAAVLLRRRDRGAR